MGSLLNGFGHKINKPSDVLFKITGANSVDIRSTFHSLCRLPYLLRLYNACLALGYFPNKWKIGNLVTILKSPDRYPKDPKALRPITLLWELAKILEQLILNKIFSHHSERTFFSNMQYGFRKALLNNLTGSEYPARLCIL